MLCSGAKVIGKPGLLTLNPVPETDACEMVICLLLLLVTEVDSVLLLPSWTLPKLREGEARAEEAIVCSPEAALAYKTTLRRSCHQMYLPSKPRRRIPPTLLLHAQTAHGGELWSRCQRDADHQAFQRSVTVWYSFGIVFRPGKSR